MKSGAHFGLTKNMLFAGVAALGFLLLVEAALQVAGLVMAGGRKTELQPGAKVIVCIGDSYTYGAWVEENESYPAQLQGLLDRSRGGYQLINLGIPGQNSTQALAALPGILRTYHPALALIMIGSNNFWNQAGHEAHWYERLAGKLKLVKLVRMVYIHFYREDDEPRLVSRGRRGGEPIIAREVTASGAEEENVELIYRQLSSDLERMLEICQAQNQKLMLMNYPYCRRKHTSFDDTNDTINQVAREHGVTLVDNEAYFCARYRGPEGGFDQQLRDQMQFSDGHPRPGGYQWVAQNIFEVFKRGGIVK